MTVRFGIIRCCISIVVLAALPAFASEPAAPSTQPKPPCHHADYRALDFWVGEWDVFRRDTGEMVARSSIVALHDGCVIREQWMPVVGAGGSSLSHYDRHSRQWHQLWLDSSGGRVNFSGGPVGDAMVITGWWPDVNGPGQDALIRMTYSRGANGSVMQRGEASIDQGRTWELNFLFEYRPHVQGSAP